MAFKGIIIILCFSVVVTHLSKQVHASICGDGEAKVRIGESFIMPYPDCQSCTCVDQQWFYCGRLCSPDYFQCQVGTKPTFKEQQVDGSGGCTCTRFDKCVPL